jgi:hypothetical protein
LAAETKLLNHCWTRSGCWPGQLACLSH